IAKPALTAITPVSMDHQDYLGDTLAAIAGEKAGILKPAVACVCAAQEPAAQDVIAERARMIGAPLVVEGTDWTAARKGEEMTVRVRGRERILPAPALVGEFQIANAGHAVACADALADILPIGDDAIAEGLRSVSWPGRLQRLTRGPLVDMLAGEDTDWELWLDGGHNPAAGQALAKQARQWRDKSLHIVFGMLNNRNPAEFLMPFGMRVRQAVAVPIPGQPNSLSAAEAADGAARAGMPVAAAPDVATAIRALLRNHKPGRILITGSLYLAGSVLCENG
ncbi:MAG: bifunctional folylpolyglutamate synthase/dihydrofolate synthase, partial [Rhodospirillales bacterium]|nr:bifunctional folylpolyglutamate synthase/dihydrofolate synthase [Rhodospirillales bacterium]